jgi:hypothetical protein
VQVLRVEQPAQVGDAVIRLLGIEQVGLVQDDGEHLGVAGHRDEESPVHRRVRVLLRVEHPQHQVGQPDEPVRLHRRPRSDRVVVRQVDQDQPAQ